MKLPSRNVTGMEPVCFFYAVGLPLSVRVLVDVLVAIFMYMYKPGGCRSVFVLVVPPSIYGCRSNTWILCVCAHVCVWRIDALEVC